MTRQEAAIVSAYTGILIGGFDNMHKYVEEVLKRSVFTHELACKDIVEEVKQASRNDFCSIVVER